MPEVGSTATAIGQPLPGAGARRRALVTAPMRGPGLDALHQLFDVVHEPWIDQHPLRIYDDPALAARVATGSFDVVVVESDLVGPETLALPLLAVAATRGDPTNVDLAAATAAGVPVLHTPGRNADAVAEHALGLLLAVLRRIPAADAEVRAGQVWRDGTIPYQRYRARELAGLTAAIIGYGAVGRALAWRLAALGMAVRAYDPYRDDASDDLSSTLDGADVVSLHAPRNAGSPLIGAAELALRAPGAVVLNTARGSLLDHVALVEALRSGRLSGAGIDHVQGEAPALGDPLLDAPGVVVTPHVAGATYDTEGRGAAMLAEDLRLLLAGAEPHHLANPQVRRRPPDGLGPADPEETTAP